jgi:hypothetical protein
LAKKQNKIQKHSPQRKGKLISEKAIAIPPQTSTDEDHPSFRFTCVDKNRWRLSDWTSSEINDLLAGLKKIEAYTWGQIKSHGAKKSGGSVGTGYKLISNHPSLPESVTEDVKLSEMRIDDKKRIFGFRDGSVYYIIWFDRDHSVCPE